MIFKHLTMSEWVRMGGSMMGGMWLVNHHFEKWGWLLIAIGCLPPMWDMTSRMEAAENEEWKEKKAEIESGGPEAVCAWNRQLELEQLKKTASMGSVGMATMLFGYATGFFVYATGIVKDTDVSQALQLRGQYWTFVLCNLAVMAVFAAWAVVAERRRRIARGKLLTHRNEVA